MFGFLRRRKFEHRARELAQTSIESERRHKEEKERHEKSMALYNRAVKAEKAGRYSQALKLYLENLDLYSPQGLSHWERPAVLLEKLKRYDEALDLCERALALDVELGPTAASIQERFARRKERLIRKMQRQGD